MFKRVDLFKMGAVKAGCGLLTRLLWVTLVLTGFQTQVQGQARAQAAGPVVGEIVIEGQRRIEEDAIRSRLSSQVGEAFSEDKVAADVRELFDTGFFYNVVVRKSGPPQELTLTYEVTEKPAIREIVYRGNSEVKDEDLREASGLRVFELLDMSLVREAVEKIERLYEEKGFFLARVSHEVQEIEGAEDVRLIFDITENEKVQVRKITIIGNNSIPTSRLKSRMTTKEGGFFSFLSGSGSYRQEAFERDLQILNFLYFNEGFVQVNIDRPQVFVTPDKRSIYITIRIEEGEQFRVSSVDFIGDLLMPKEELLDAISIDDSEIFVYETLQRDREIIEAMYGDLGYAYVNVIPRPQIREREREVDLVFEIDKGNKVHIGRINVLGNTKTRDKVVRRELRIFEGELYNETRKRQSMANVRRLGFFEEVSFNTKTPPDDPDKMDIDIVVRERNTGTIQVGAGYSSFQKFIFTGQVNQTNFLGRGQNLGASLEYSQRQSIFKFSFTEPYLMDTEWSLGLDAYQMNRVLTEYRELKKGGAIRVGHPLAPYLYGFLRYRLDDTDITLNADADPALFPVETAEGIRSSITASIEYDRRNDRFMPTDGIYSSLSLEYAGLGGDQKFTKGFANFRYYKEIFWKLVWRNNINYAFITSNDPAREPPFNDLFLLGGANSLRGFDWFTVGRRKYSERAYDDAISGGLSPSQAELYAMRPFGGKQQFYYNLEFQFPLIEEAGIHAVVFYDIGNAEDQLRLSDMRMNVGYGFRWFSPIGPLRFEFGFPIDRREEYGESAMSFHFAIGSPF